MPKAKLTKRTVEAHAAKDTDVFLWDTALPGFGVRIKPSGAKTFLIQYRNAEGLSKRYSIGKFGVLSADQARHEAQQLLAAVARGGDPSSEKQERREAPTMAELAERYLVDHARIKKKASSVRSDETLLRNHILPSLGNRKVQSINRADILKLHREMHDRPGAANRTLALLSKMFNLAEAWDLRPDRSNPTTHVERYKERRLERYLTAEELARLSEAMNQAEIDGTATKHLIAALRLLILTGCRAGEILTLQWSQVDWDRGCLFLPTSKTGPKVVHLNEPALDVLQALWASRDKKNSFVIEGEMPGQHLVDYRRAWHRIRARAGLEDVRVHDLRHTFASIAAGLGEGLPMIGKLLGHTQPATTSRYAHLADDPVRRAGERVAAKLSDLMQGQQGKVVQLRHGARGR